MPAFSVLSHPLVAAAPTALSGGAVEWPLLPAVLLAVSVRRPESTVALSVGDGGVYGALCLGIERLGLTGRVTGFSAHDSADLLAAHNLRYGRFSLLTTDPPDPSTVESVDLLVVSGDLPTAERERLATQWRGLLAADALVLVTRCGTAPDPAAWFPSGGMARCFLRAQGGGRRPRRSGGSALGRNVRAVRTRRRPACGTGCAPRGARRADAGTERELRRHVRRRTARGPGPRTGAEHGA